MFNSNMKITLVTLMVMSSCFHQTKSACCSRVEADTFECSTAHYIMIAGQKITKNSSDTRIKLPGVQTEETYFCGKTKDTITWATLGGANQLRFNYESDGTVYWRAYCCDDLTGPTKADIKCALQEVSEICPKSNLDNATCVYELITNDASSQTTTTVKSVTGEAAAKVMAKAEGFSVKAVEQSESVLNESQMVTTSEGHFLVIPAGFSFCAYTEAISVKDVHAPSGFSWKCSLTKFVQTSLKLDNPSTCVNLTRCDDGVCGVDVDTCSSPTTCNTGSGFPIWASSLISVITCGFMVCLYRCFLEMTK